MDHPEQLFLVRLPDDAVYATGPQGGIPGGPVLYEDAADARTMAKSQGGRVEGRSFQDAVAKATDIGAVLWLKRADGRIQYVQETVATAGRAHTVPIGGDERQAALDAASDIRERKE